jgi:phosphoribosyl 1,2-cyclic phosphodiesterase
LVKNETHVFYLKEDIVTFENLLQVAVAKLCDEVDVIEVFDALTLGHEHFDHPHDVGVLAILQQHDLTQDPACFWQ